MSDALHPRTEQWLSFEMRMRQRRFARCVEHARVALDAGDIAAAESAIEEARTLQRDSSELSNLDARLSALKSAPAIVEVAGTTEADAVAPIELPYRTDDADAVETIELPYSTEDLPAFRTRQPGARRLTPWVATAAGLAVVAAGTAYGVKYWTGWNAQRTPQSTAQSAPKPELPPRAAADVTPASQMANRLRIVHETVRAPEISPRFLVDEPRLPAFPGPPIAEPEPQSQPEPVMLAVNRGESNPVPPETQPRLEAQPEIRLDPVTPPPVTELPARAVVPPGDPVALPAARSTPAPAVEEASLTRDESSVVRSVLRRYETAYSNLDANEASQVWPAVNRGQLARAFEGLASQRVSLGACDVTVNGLAARAVCSGSATWEPKVGGGVRTEARRWSFDLRKSGEAWRIERAVAR